MHLGQREEQRGEALSAGDGLVISGEPSLTIAGTGEVMLFDLP